MRSLVTGAFGFAGKFLVDHLVAQGDKVLGTYLFDELKDPICSATLLDVTDEKECLRVIQEFKPECIYHLAGIAFVPDAERDFTRTLLVNVAGTHNIFRACTEIKLKTRLVLVSSAQVYGKVDTCGRAIDESMPLRPGDNYSVSKCMAEQVALRFQDTTPSVVIRPFNHIGPAQRLEFVVSNFANQLVQISRGERPAVLQVGNLDVRRDFTDVRDIVRGYHLAATHGSGIYNLCSGRATSIREILDTLIEISGVEVKIETDPARMRTADIPELYGSYALAKRDLKWEPSISLRQSLQDVYEYWLRHNT